MRTIHLIRHGEVRNPDHVVYADLDGFGLSDLGNKQALATAERLASRPLAAIVHSPLQRAVETAAAIATRHDVAVEADDRLTEWKVGARWAGIVWEDLPHRRPGELEAYLDHPTELPFSPEPLSTVAARVAAAIAAAMVRYPDGEVAFVAHQDPVQAAHLALTGVSLAALHQDKPGHAEIITLSTANPSSSEHWSVTERWAPEQGGAFPPVDGA